MAGRNAEIAADVGDDGADWPTTHLFGDFLLGGEAREAWVFGVVGGFDVRWRRLLRCSAWRAYGRQADGRYRQIPAAGSALAELGFQHRGATQAAGDAV